MYKISVCIPTYNVAHFLTECLESIIHQIFQNWEVIIVDDFSTDNTWQILQSFAQKDTRIKPYKNEQKKGIIGALQTAYKYTSGDLITRMDSDDIMLPNKLSDLSAILIQKGRGTLAIGQVQYFNNQGLKEGYLKYQQWLNKLTIANNNFAEIYKECVIPSPAWLCWRTDFEACGGFQSATYPEDYDLAFRFYKMGLNCVGTRQMVHQWRDYSSRTSRTDPNYADNRFLDLKLKYFLMLEYDSKKQLVLWGAGKKGKLIAQKLKVNNVSFSWICNNEKKIGKHIYDIMLTNVDNFNFENTQLIISIAGTENQAEIKAFLHNKITTDELFFFC